MTGQTTPEALRQLLDPISEARKLSEARLLAWEAISKNVLGYLQPVCRALEQSKVMPPLHAQRGSAPGNEVLLRFDGERVPMVGNRGSQDGASLRFGPTLSGLIVVRAVGFWVAFDQRLVGPEPVREVLGRFEPEVLAAEKPVMDLVERFFAIAVKTHWTQAETVEI